MVKHFDHVTVVVSDVARAKEFFGLLGFVAGIAGELAEWHGN